MTLVVDASALIALAKQEPGASIVSTLLADASALRLMHAVNVCEVYYHFLIKGDRHATERAVRDPQRVGLVIRRDISKPFWRQVAHVKADVRRVSLADSFAIALAQQVGGEVVTADHGEFDFVAARSVCGVRFIR